MRLHRFLGGFNFESAEITIDDEKIISQITKVLRLKEGDEIILGNGKGKEILVEIKTIQKKEIICEAVRSLESESESSTFVTLYCAILKNEHFEMVAEKATEAGISRIVPLITRRTVKLKLNKTRLEKIMKEAAEQSGRVKIPTLEEPLIFETALKEASANDLNYFFSLRGKRFEQIRRPTASFRLGLFIGPEGGWDESEEHLAISNNHLVVSLGKLTLRAETAAIIGSYLLVNS